MITLRHLIFDVRNRLKLYSDDSTITNQYLEYLINTERTKLARQRISNAQRDIPREYKQELYLNMEVNTDVLGVELLISTDTIPKLLNSTSIDSVTTITGDANVIRRFNMVSYSRLPYVGVSAHLNTLVYGAISDEDRLILKSGNSNAKLINVIRLRGVFSDVKEAMKLSEGYDENIDYWDVEYPIDPAIIPDLINSIVSQLINRFKIPEDKINDAEETA